MNADAKTLRRPLLRWFDAHKRALPWRETKDPYAIWVSEVMLQQTQVATVIPYWKRFLKRFPDVVSLAQAEEEAVLALWRGLGYYSRGRNLHRAAKAIAAEHGGKLPGTAQALLELPGFGRYTAGAVASIAFGQPVPVVDGNVARVLSRVFLVEGTPGQKEREKKLWAIATALCPQERPGDWNQALMELGALVCKSDEPSCAKCPIRRSCGAHLAGRAHELPPPRIRGARKPLVIAAAVVRRGERLWLGLRPSGGLYGGLWELPCIELPADSTEAQARASLTHLCGAGAQIGPEVGRVSRVLTHRNLEIRLHAVTAVQTLRPGAAQYERLRLWHLSELDTLGVSTAMQRAIDLAINERTSPIHQRTSAVGFLEGARRRA